MKFVNADGITTIGTRLPDRDDRDWITAKELLNEVPQITYRQLDYWCRTGLIEPMDDIPGSGWTRRLHQDQIARARNIAVLLDAGVSLQVIRQIVDEFTATGRATSGALTFVLEQPTTEGDNAA